MSDTRPEDVEKCKTIARVRLELACKIATYIGQPLVKPRNPLKRQSLLQRLQRSRLARKAVNWAFTTFDFYDETFHETEFNKDWVKMFYNPDCGYAFPRWTWPNLSSRHMNSDEEIGPFERDLTSWLRCQEWEQSDWVNDHHGWYALCERERPGHAQSQILEPTMGLVGDSRCVSLAGEADRKSGGKYSQIDARVGKICIGVCDTCPKQLWKLPSFRPQGVSPKIWDHLMENRCGCIPVTCKAGDEVCIETIDNSWIAGEYKRAMHSRGRGG